MFKHWLCIQCFLLSFLVQNAYGDWSTEVESELAYSEPQQKTTKADLILSGQWRGYVDDASFTVIPKLLLEQNNSLHGDAANNSDRADSYSAINGPVYEDQNHRFELAEAYSDIWFGETSVRLGKQQVVWGQADGLKVLDVINPQNYREFNLAEFEDSRIPTWMLNLQHPTGDDASVQLLIIPDLTFNELADPGSQFAITSPELAPQPVAGVPITLAKTQHPKAEVESGIRWSGFINGWDISANYFYYFQDSPVVYRDAQGSGASFNVIVTPTYERSQLLGFSANTVLDSWVLKMELGYIHDNYFLRNDVNHSGIQVSDELASVLAVDYHGISELMISYQLFVSRILDYAPEVVRQQTSTRHTLLLKQNLWNQTLELKWFTLFNPDYDDGQSRLKATYKLNDQWNVFTGVDYFYGDRAGPFGQFKDASRITLGWQWAY